MNESDIDRLGNREPPRRKSGHPVAITAIIVFGILVLACIVAATAVAMVFIINAPW
jgi:hypothetical protein